MDVYIVRFRCAPLHGFIAKTGGVTKFKDEAKLFFSRSDAEKCAASYNSRAHQEYYYVETLRKAVR